MKTPEVSCAPTRILPPLRGPFGDEFVDEFLDEFVEFVDEFLDEFLDEFVEGNVDGLMDDGEGENARVEDVAGGDVQVHSSASTIRPKSTAIEMHNKIPAIPCKCLVGIFFAETSALLEVYAACACGRVCIGSMCVAST